MLLIQVCFIFIYILFIELAIITVVAIALFVTLIVTTRKLDSKKNTSLSGRQRCILILKNTIQRYATFLWSLIFIYLFIPDKLDLTKSEMAKTIDVARLCNYLVTTDKLFMEQEAENTKEQKTKVNE